MHYIFRDSEGKPYGSIDLFTVLHTRIVQDSSLSIVLNNGENVMVPYRNNPENLEAFFTELGTLHQE